MGFSAFEEIKVWQKARDLNLIIFSSFRNCKNYSFRDQIQRASVSISNNIAEGYERNGNKEFRNFLYISKGSVAEVRSMCYLALDLGYIDQEMFDELLNRTTVIAKMISGLIKTL